MSLDREPIYCPHEIMEMAWALRGASEGVATAVGQALADGVKTANCDHGGNMTVGAQDKWELPPAPAPKCRHCSHNSQEQVGTVYCCRCPDVSYGVIGTGFTPPRPDQDHSEKTEKVRKDGS